MADQLGNSNSRPPAPPEAPAASASSWPSTRALCRASRMRLLRRRSRARRCRGSSATTTRTSGTASARRLAQPRVVVSLRRQHDDLKEFRLTTTVSLFSSGRRSVDRSQRRSAKIRHFEAPAVFGGFGGLSAPNLRAAPFTTSLPVSLKPREDGRMRPSPRGSVFRMMGKGTKSMDRTSPWDVGHSRNSGRNHENPPMASREARRMLAFTTSQRSFRGECQIR